MTSLINKEDCVEISQKKIETNLNFYGITAIEDKLQDDVDITIERLRKAGISIWMLTGDKLETAINIGKSTSIIQKNSELIIIDGLDHNEIFLQLNKYYNIVKTLLKY